MAWRASPSSYVYAREKWFDTLTPHEVLIDITTSFDARGNSGPVYVKVSHGESLSVQYEYPQPAPDEK